MGLDITAHRGPIKALTPDELNEDGEPLNWAESSYQGFGRVFANPNFPGRNDGLADGYYTVADSMAFRAGSYSGYNWWRNELAKVAGYGSAKAFWDSGSPAGPFAELVHFSDCDGCIGPATSAKLAKDFADFQDKADAYEGDGSSWDESSWFKSQYATWRKAFEMAADGGFVEFH